MEELISINLLLHLTSITTIYNPTRTDFTFETPTLIFTKFVPFKSVEKSLAVKIAAEYLIINISSRTY